MPCTPLGLTMGYLDKKSTDFVENNIFYWIGHHFGSGCEAAELAQIRAADKALASVPDGTCSTVAWKAVVDCVRNAVDWEIEPTKALVKPNEIRDNIYKFFSSQDEKIEDAMIKAALQAEREGLGWEEVCERAFNAEKQIRNSV